MKRFLRKFFWFYSFPVGIYFLALYIIDPLECFHSYQEYYKNTFVPPNRENVCLNLFEQNDSMPYFNSFILGNSCSHAYKTDHWTPFLPSDAKSFHMDAYRETIGGILMKLKYLRQKGNSVKNALIIIDRSTFSRKFDGYMYVMPKKLDEESNRFYEEHFKTLTSLKFVFSYCYYSIFHTNLSFMKDYQFSKQNLCNNQTADLYYLADFDIARDSATFFETLSHKEWIDRDKVMNIFANDAFEGLNARNIGYLKQIKQILKECGTEYKLVINPCYNQIAIPLKELHILEDIFGAGNVYDFSGVNDISQDYTNFYDGIHYRPLVADKIMKAIYQGSDFK